MIVCAFVLSVLSIGHNYFVYGISTDKATNIKSVIESNTNVPSDIEKMQSDRVKKITIQFHNKEKKVSNRYRVKSLKKILNSKYYIRTPKKDSGKGWIYTIRGNSRKGKNISKVTIVDANHISINGKTYKVEKLNLKKIGYCFKNGNKTPILSSEKIKTVTVQFQGKYRNIKSKNKIKKLKKMFVNTKFVQTKNATGKGWIYRIKAKNIKGKVLEDITILDKNHISYMDDTYKCKINLKRLDKLFGVNRY